MFSKVSDFLKGEVSLQIDSSGNPSDEDLLIATGVLLLEMAGSDDDYDPSEVRTIFSVMEEQFGIQQGEVHQLLAEADELRKENDKIDQFVDTINAQFKAQQRQQVLAMIWKVVLADGHIDKFEERFAEQIKFRLKLTDEEAKQARELAENM